MNGNHERATCRDVVKSGLCCGCGACAGACSAGAVSMCRNAAGFLVSETDLARCVGCGICRASCPACIEKKPNVQAEDFGTCLLCHAVDLDTRRRAQSGGVTTALLKFLLASGRIDGAVLTRFNPESSAPEAFLASSPEEVETACGSLYAQTAVVEVALRHRERRLAVVALGCQARALAHLADAGLFAARPVMLGLACESNYSLDYVAALAAHAGMAPTALRGFQFRHKFSGGWPGNVLVSDGTCQTHVSSRERLRLKKVYEVPACLACADKLNAAADVVIGDPWGFDNAVRQAWNNVVLARTAAGEDLLAGARAANAIAGSPVPVERVLEGQGVAAGGPVRADVDARMRFACAVMNETDKQRIAVLRADRQRELFLSDKWKGAPGFSKGRAFKVLAYGFGLGRNFGGPSVFHGLESALAQLYPGHELTVYQPTPVDPVSVSDVNFTVKEFPYRRHPFKLYRDWLLLKLFGRKSNSKACAAFWEDFMAADAVAFAYPICFCSRIKTATGVTSRRGAIRAFFRVFGVSLLARLSGKASVKTTASFGPTENPGNRLLARLACRFAFTRVVAREEECRRELAEVSGVKREIVVAPDLANAWHSRVAGCEPDLLGFSVSYQLREQWTKRGLDYISLVARLVEHAARTYGCRILLIPNQCESKVPGRTDVDVANEVLSAVSGVERISVFDCSAQSPTALHDAIARCSAMVTARYHSCVAGFASGVPQLILGWHCKYMELAKRYGQESLVFSDEDCTLERLVSRLDGLWAARAEVREKILSLAPQVESSVRDSVHYLFGAAYEKHVISVSVVVPVCNVEKYLPRCLDSLIVQTLKDIEIICVDDGSTDGSLAILQGYAARDPRITVLHQENAGAGAARNAGIDKATGEYLFFFDPDDGCEKDMLEAMYRKAKKTEADVVVAGKKIVDAETGKLIEDKPLPRRLAWFYRKSFPPSKIADRLFSFAKAVPWDKLFRRAFVEESQLRFMALPRSNDVYFVDMALALAKRIALVRKGYYRYSRRRGGSLTFSKDRHPLATIQAYDAIEASLKEHGLWERFRASFAEVYFQLAVHNLSSFREEANFRTVYGLMRERLLRYAEGQNFEENPRIPRGVVRRGRMLLAEESPDALWKDLEGVRQRVKERESAK